MRNNNLEILSGPASFRDRATITFYGSRKDQEIAKKAVEAIPGIEMMAEPEARLKIQEVMDKQGLKATIMFDGNDVVSLVRIIRNLKQIMEAGKLYRHGAPRMAVVAGCIVMPVGGTDIILSDYFYHFLDGHCGSIAHFNKRGWVAIYPTLDDLKAFFKRNEYGQRVLDDIPGWKTDAKRIVVAIEAQLFPFESYMNKKQKVKALEENRFQRSH